MNDDYGLWEADIKKIEEEWRNERRKDMMRKIGGVDGDYFLMKGKDWGLQERGLETVVSELEVRDIMITGIAGNI